MIKDFISNRYSASRMAIIGLLTSLAIGLPYLGFNYISLFHLLCLRSSIWHLDPFIPQSEKWQIMPFFYVIGGFPKEFSGNPIFYSLPYEIGPPYKFIGHIIAYWTQESIGNTSNSSSIRFIIEGPKTPQPINTQERIRECFTSNSNISCYLMKYNILKRHFSELKAIYPDEWIMSWFHIDNTLLTQESQIQGIYLSAVGKYYIYDRFIIININGTHQSFSLIRPKTELGLQAFNLIKQVIGSLRSFHDLDPGKAWISRELERVKLENLKSITDRSLLIKLLSEIQSLLISRTSVDPASLDSYFHLAGTSILLLKNGIKRIGDPIGILARQNVESTSKYSIDISPQDPKTIQIQDIWLEIQKQYSN